ncbi:MAG: oxygen-dependent coproporphyrinogen oxidase [Bdellovibrionales bacterium]
MDWDTKKQTASDWFLNLRDQICAEFETLEQELSGGNKAELPVGAFERKPWQRDKTNQPNESGSTLNGGGEMSVMRGRVFEKVGVNYSQVHGRFSPEFAEKIPGAVESDGEFWACGVSLVAHMQSPLVPATHMNTRMIVTSKGWFGGGADLTPMVENEDDTRDFHAAMKANCDAHDPSYYPEHKDWADRYFYLPHRDEPRGVGGTFYDYLDSGDWDHDFSYTKGTGLAFKDGYAGIVRKHMNRPWNDEQREHQLIRRGRYVEYNLIYDRGTQFGLKTGGNTEAILMSMPPEVKWP